MGKVGCVIAAFGLLLIPVSLLWTTVVALLQSAGWARNTQEAMRLRMRVLVVGLGLALFGFLVIVVAAYR